MVIFTAKLSKKKLVLIVCAAAAILLAVVLAANRHSAGELSPERKLATAEAQAEFLAECGLTVEAEPVRVQEVTIPETFSQVYTQYNALQIAQGFDLTKYRGKRAVQYVYQVTNYPEDNGDPVYAILLLRKDRLIAADLNRGGTESFLRPLLPV